MDVRRIKDYLTKRSVSIASILEMNKLRWWEINDKCKEKTGINVRKTGMEAKALVSVIALYGKILNLYSSLKESQCVVHCFSF